MGDGTVVVRLFDINTGEPRYYRVEKKFPKFEKPSGTPETQTDMEFVNYKVINDQRLVLWVNALQTAMIAHLEKTKTIPAGEILSYREGEGNDSIHVLKSIVGPHAKTFRIETLMPVVESSAKEVEFYGISARRDIYLIDQALKNGCAITCLSSPLQGVLDDSSFVAEHVYSILAIRNRNGIIELKTVDPHRRFITGQDPDDPSGVEWVSFNRFCRNFVNVMISGEKLDEVERTINELFSQEKRDTVRAADNMYFFKEHSTKIAFMDLIFGAGATKKSFICSANRDIWIKFADDALSYLKIKPDAKILDARGHELAVQPGSIPPFTSKYLNIKNGLFYLTDSETVSCNDIFFENFYFEPHKGIGRYKILCFSHPNVGEFGELKIKVKAVNFTWEHEIPIYDFYSWLHYNENIYFFV